MDSIWDGEYGEGDESQDDGVVFDAEQAHHMRGPLTSAYHHQLTLISTSLSLSNVAPFSAHLIFFISFTLAKVRKFATKIVSQQNSVNHHSRAKFHIFFSL